MEQAALGMAEPRDNESFLVIGFGPGVGLELLLDAVAPAAVLGVDPSRAMVNAARRRLARHRLRRSVELLRAPATGIPAARTFDAAIAVNCEQFWDPHRDSLEAIASALRPGGRLVTVTHQWAIEKRHSLPDWKALVQADLAGAGLGAPAWSQDRYRSGPAIAYLARQPGQRKRRTCP
jgi:SAM-dependent methyltransferase